MAVRNTIRTEVFWNDVLVAKVTDISPVVSRDALDDTATGQQSATSKKGLLTTTLSCTCWYDPDDPGAVAMINSVYDQGEPLDELKLVPDRDSEDGVREFPCFVTNVGQPHRVRELVSCSIQFSVSGDVSKDFSGNLIGA